MAWRLAKSLVTLRDQVNAAYPNRSKDSDGTIGDADHAGTSSDHNPNAQGVVCAFDLTHDPAHGCDGEVIVQAQRKNPHPDLAYMVWRGQIYSRIRGFNPVPNNGHYKHVHFSVGVGTDGRKKQPYDDTNPWDIGSGSPVPPQPKGVLVSKSKVFEAKVKTDGNGDGYVDVYHGEPGNPLGSFATANGGISNGKYPAYTPLFWCAGREGTHVRVTVVKCQANAEFTFKLHCDW